MSHKRMMKRLRKARKKRERQRRRVEATPVVLVPQPCGGCTACCTCVAVEELRKGFYRPCSFCNGQGCVTYANRPPSCAAYACAYAAGLTSERPDQCGVLFSTERIQGEPILAVYEVQPDVLMDKLAFVFETADRLARDGVMLRRLELYRYGTEIPTAWDGQHYQTTAVILGNPNEPPQIWFTVRADHDEADRVWWMQALEKVLEAVRWTR